MTVVTESLAGRHYLLSSSTAEVLADLPNVTPVHFILIGENTIVLKEQHLKNAQPRRTAC
jgi:hypothetical protein